MRVLHFKSQQAESLVPGAHRRHLCASVLDHGGDQFPRLGADNGRSAGRSLLTTVRALLNPQGSHRRRRREAVIRSTCHFSHDPHWSNLLKVVYPLF